MVYLNPSGGVALGLKWHWLDGVATWEVLDSNGSHWGDWDGAGAFSSLPSGTEISLNPPSAVPLVGPNQGIRWNQTLLAFDNVASQQAGADVYSNGSMRITIGRGGLPSSRSVVANDGVHQFTGSYDQGTRYFNFGSAAFGVVEAKHEGQTITSTQTGRGTGGGNDTAFEGDLDVSGNLFTLGNWINLSGASVNGLTLAFDPGSQASVIRFDAIRPLTDFVWRTSPNAERMRITSGGNVGIGTTTPGTRLEIGDTNPALTLTAGSGGFGRTSTIGLSGTFPWTEDATHSAGRISSGFSAYEWASSYLAFVTRVADSAEVLGMIITNGGNVGIGTSNPVEKLHVTGDVKVDGVIRIPKAGDIEMFVPVPPVP